MLMMTILLYFIIEAGSLNSGICEGEEDRQKDLVAGKCYCKANVDGPR